MKQRVVGAIVLVALAVIFLPMLLDGSGRPERVDLEVEIPEEPEAPASRLDEAPAAGTTTGPAAQAGEATSGAAAQPDPAQTSTQGGGASATGGDAEDGGATAAGADGTTDAAEGPSAWVVQVGSFAQETNALVLRDRLQQRGYDAFAEQGSSDGRVLWRVRVGPVPTRARAESLKQRLEEQRDRAALVMSYP